VPLVRTGTDFWDALGRVIDAQDEPTHSLNVLAQDGLMSLARQHGLKVLMTGEGADETAAGYHSYFREYWLSLLRHWHPVSAVREMAAFAGAHPGTNMLAHAVDLARHAAFQALGHLQPYREARLAARRSSLAHHPWFTGDLALLAAEQSLPTPTSLDEALRQAVEVYPLPLYLRVLDHVSMAHSVEVREPFLDYRLVALTFSLPSDVKLRGPWNKWLLREATRGRIPEIVRSRVAKFGFPVPVQSWVRDGFYQPLRDLLSSQRARERGVYHTGKVLERLERLYRDGATPPFELERTLQFELWMRSVESTGTLATPAIVATSGG
jgi:asparagine synthase (glutamine-hydrolysing)